MGAFASVAARYRSLGLSVIPTNGEDGKIPCITKYMRYAGYLPSLDTIAEFSHKFPEANVGILAGPVSRLTVVDLDDRDLLDDALAEFGETPLIVRSSGGYHLYYRHAGEKSTNRLDGRPIDVRGAGGNPLIIVPPSVRPDTGDVYSFIRGSFNELERLPAAQFGSLRRAPACQNDGSKGVEKGQRNDSLFRYALRQARNCDDQAQLLDVVQTRNEELPEPLPESEVVTLVRSASRIQEEGRNRIGSGGYAQVILEDLERLGSDGNACLLLCHLRANHAVRKESFAVANAMAARMGWSKATFRKARRKLEDLGLIVPVHRGGRGARDPHLYRWPK